MIIGEGANIARTLSNRASNDVSPEVLADEARAIAEQHGLWIDVIEPEQATELGMGMFMAVGRGSDNPPRMIVMRSGGEGERDALDRHLAIVGKGVCFDSGGISIKPSDRMEEMKMDKTGACTVIAAIATVARLAPGTPLLALAPAVENMPGPHSTRPGDIVTALNGKKVDITNTDAEGRLILGDAMTYAERLGATHLVDVATLTGAVSRALGHLVTRRLRDAAGLLRRRSRPRATGPASATGSCRSSTSTCPRWTAGTATSRTPGSAEGSLVKSGLFLREFVTVPWVHLDIAGTAYFRKATAVRAARRDRRLARHARRARARRGARRTDRRPGRTGRPTARPRTHEPWSRWPGCSAVAGLALGLAADRFATRWPEHDEEHPPGPPRRLADGGRRPSSGRVAFGLLPLRFGGDPLAFALFGAWFVTLVVGLATDLDQRLLPDVLTLPVIPVALVYALSGQNPLVGTDLLVGARRRDRHPGSSCTCRRSRSGPGRSGSATSSCSSGSG